MNKKGTAQIIALLLIVLIALGAWLYFGGGRGSLSIVSLGNCLHDEGQSKYQITCTSAKATIETIKDDSGINFWVALTGSDNPAQRGYTKSDFTGMECEVYTAVGNFKGKVEWPGTCHVIQPRSGVRVEVPPSGHIKTVFTFYKSEGGGTVTTPVITDSTTTTIASDYELPPGRTSIFWRFIYWLRSIFGI